MRFGERRTAVIGTTLITISMLGFCAAAYWAGTSETASLAALLFGLVVAGVGFGFTQPSIQAVVGNAVSPSHFGIASSALSMAGSVGAVAGVSFLTALCADAVTGQPYLVGYSLAAGASAASLLGALRMSGRRVNDECRAVLPTPPPDRVR
jgi:MFS family permease